MNNKKVLGSLLIVILILSLGFYFYKFFLIKKEKVNDISKAEVSQQEKIPGTNTVLFKENKYYSVYIRSKDDKYGSSFVPLKLNPGFKADSNYNVSISTDDDGNIIGNKIIVINNFVISDENKEMIKKIAGTNYNEALKEIEDGVNNAKKDYQKQELNK